MRVISGKHRGTPLQAPKGRSVRPTTDRVKESMFAPLQFSLDGASVLDVFGGSGALGLEAASRGASRVVIIEKSRGAQQAIRANIEACGTPRTVELLAMPWEAAFELLHGTEFDFVFVDPPYQSGQYVPVLEGLRRESLLDSAALVVLESDKELNLEVPGFEFVRSRQYGTVIITWMRPAPEKVLSAPVPGTAGCVCPGSYDPVTLGHLDVIRRAQQLFGRVYVGLLDNVSKQYMFSARERERILRNATGGLPDVEVVRWDGLLVELLDRLGIGVIVRGVRSGADFAAEEQLAAINSSLRSGTETVLLPADPSLRAVSSTAVRELIRFGADVSAFVPAAVTHFLADKAARP